MTDTSGGTPPFGSFSGMTGFSPGRHDGKMWDMMKLNPFAAAAGGSPSAFDDVRPCSRAADHVEELDKRIKDMRAVEQWLKLNLNMLQSGHSTSAGSASVRRSRRCVRSARSR